MKKLLTLLGIIFSAILWVWVGGIVVLNWYSGGAAIADMFGRNVSDLINLLLFDIPWYEPFAAAFIISCLVGAAALRSKRPPKPANKATFLRLKFERPNAPPKLLDSSNIWHWYALRNVATFKDSNDIQYYSHTCSLFMILDTPADFSGVKIDSDKKQALKYQVSNIGPRHAVIVFDSDMADTLVTITCIMTS